MPNMHFIFSILLSYFIRLFKEGLNAFSLKGPKYPFLQKGSPKMNFLFCLRDAVLYLEKNHLIMTWPTTIHLLVFLV